MAPHAGSPWNGVQRAGCIFDEGSRGPASKPGLFLLRMLLRRARNESSNLADMKQFPDRSAY